MKGYTLIEVWVVMAILGILLAWGLPSFQAFYQSRRAAALPQIFLETIRLARDQAFLTGQATVLCGSKDLKTCSGDWSAGLLVTLHDRMRYAVTLPKTPLTITWRGFSKASPRVIFDLKTLAANGLFTAFDAQSPRWTITLNKSGRAYLEWIPSQK